MTTQLLLVVFLFVLALFVPALVSPRRHWLSKPLIGDDDGRVYVCSDKTLFAFESNGSIAWSLHVDYKCNIGIAPVHGGPGKVSESLTLVSI